MSSEADLPVISPEEVFDLIVEAESVLSQADIDNTVIPEKVPFHTKLGRLAIRFALGFGDVKYVAGDMWY